MLLAQEAPPHDTAVMTRSSFLSALFVITAVTMAPGSAMAQSANRSPAPPALTAAPSAPPEARASVTRDAEGRLVVHTARVDRPLVIDGVLDERFYETVLPVTDFIQVEPQAGRPAVARTEGWLAFDDTNIYIAFRAWDDDMGHVVATEMRRDNGTIWSGNDNIVFVFDTFRDRRSSVSFTVNPLGGRSDGQVINERQFNPDWNPVWNLKTGRFEGGWTLEASVPFKSLRYQAGARQEWGFNAMRVRRSTNEISTFSPVPASQGQQGVEQPVYAATLLGIEAPTRVGGLDLKPYVTASLASNAGAVPVVTNRLDQEVGLDARYAIGRNLAADLTWNTDFAQVEADQAQVNLTRFSLFFPEKREVFLENQGVFSFGGVPVGSLNAGASDSPILFYSRRIGLQDGRPVPIIGGGRLTGRAGGFGLGLVSVQTGADSDSGASGANFSVARVRRDILGRSSIGAIASNRRTTASGAGNDAAWGVDGTFALLRGLQINTYWSQVSGPATRGSGRDRSSHRAQLDYTGDRYGVQAERLQIGSRFAPGVGFVRRADMVRSYGQARFSPRAPAESSIRKYLVQGSFDHIENTRGRLETRTAVGEAALEFRNADRLGLLYTRSHEFLPAPFRIASGVTLPVGVYDFGAMKLNFNMSQQRTVSANLSAEVGSFYNGRKTTLSIARGKVPLSTQLSIEPTYIINRVTLAQGRFTAHVGGSRITYTMTPMMFVSALVQYSSSARTLSANARFRWEYRPGSELFVVYNEERDTRVPGFPAPGNRALIVKANRLFRF